MTLGSFLKLTGVAPTGGQAKILIQCGDVRVNGRVEMRRGRRLEVGDVVAVPGAEYCVCMSPP
ncbi:MAG: RNA-binding S4 domain-containing protein [Thermoleophilia bacterium]